MSTSTEEVTFAGLLRENEEAKAKFEETRKTKFIPVQGEVHEIVVMKNTLRKATIQGKDGTGYSGFSVEVVDDDKEKTWTFFRDTALTLALALKEHPDGKVKVSQPKGKNQKIVVT